MIEITESEMTFHLDEHHNWHIENSSLYGNIKDHGVKTVEFITMFEEKCTFIEAKKTSPKDLEEYNKEILHKFTHSFNLFIANKLNMHGDIYTNELPEIFRKLKLSKTGFQFILIIKETKEEWCQQVMEHLQKLMKPFIKIWNLSPNAVKVLSYKMAREKNLVA